MSSAAYSLVPTTSIARAQSFNGSRLKSSDCLIGLGFRKNLSSAHSRSAKLLLRTTRGLRVQAAYSNRERSGSSNAFIGGFVLGGLIVGTLGCLCAPQISKVLADADGMEIMKKLPDFIYDEDKALARTRKRLDKKISQLSSAIDGISSQLQAKDSPNDVATELDGVEAVV